MSNMMNQQLSMSEAYALAEILDAYSRLGIGQVDILSDMIRMDSLYEQHNGLLRPSSIDTASQAEAIIREVERILEYPYGASYGIGHDFVDDDALRSWEVKKTLDQAIANHRNPNPTFRGVNYDGLIIRYTKDPIPKVDIQGEGEGAELTLCLSQEQFAVVKRAVNLMFDIMSGSFSAITELCKNDYLIPFARTREQGRPTASEDQIKALEASMKALESTMGYGKPFSLSGIPLPKYYQSTISLKEKLQAE